MSMIYLKRKNFNEHDTIHGSNLFYEHEISILDLPLLQRLRHISQVDLVPLIFPSANHNRFEHTLGVTAVADKMLKAIRGKDSNMVSEDEMNNVRMAAILRDCGHGPFSHIDEWTTAFTRNKYQGFVFCPNSIREKIHQAAKEVIEEAFDIRFNEYARILCKMDTNNK